MEIESYFPSTVNETEEFKTIAKAENPLITDLWEDLSIILEEMFIMTMGIEGIERFEKMLDIKPESEDLEERRKTIIAVLMGEIPYTLPFLVEKAKEYFGDDTTVSVEYEKYLVSIKAYDRFEEQQRAFKVFLRRILPANMLYHLIQGFKVPNRLSIRANLGGSAFMKMPLGVEGDYPPATDISAFIMNGTAIVSYIGSDTDVVIPRGVTSVFPNAFEMTNVKAITIPSSFNNSMNGFYGAIMLETVNFPETGNISLGGQCFGICTSLKSITLPESIKLVEEGVFTGCDNLMEIIVNQPKGSLSGSPWGAKNATVIWKG